MVLNDVYESFVSVSPICVMARATLENVLAEDRLNAIFDQNSERQRDGELMFSTVADMMGSVGKLGPFAFSPDGERMAYVGSVDINDPSPGRLYVTSSSGGERREVVPEYLGHVDNFVWQDDTNIRWLGSRGVYTEWAVASVVDTRSPESAPQPGPIVRAVHGNPGQDAVAAIADSPQHPFELYLLRGGEEPLRLTDSNPFLADRELAKQEAITYEARDGRELEAILIHPAQRVESGAARRAYGCVSLQLPDLLLSKLIVHPERHLFLVSITFHRFHL